MLTAALTVTAFVVTLLDLTTFVHLSLVIVFRLGQKQGDWSEGKNNRLVKKMDANGDGVLQASEFADGFEKALPEDQKKFKMVVKEFMDVAKSCRENKQASRDKEEKAAKKAAKEPVKEPVKKEPVSNQSPSPVRPAAKQPAKSAKPVAAPSRDEPASRSGSPMRAPDPNAKPISKEARLSMLAEVCATTCALLCVSYCTPHCMSHYVCFVVIVESQSFLSCLPSICSCLLQSGGERSVV